VPRIVRLSGYRFSYEDDSPFAADAGDGAAFVSAVA
jgi:hypothetical protein